MITTPVVNAVSNQTINSGNVTSMISFSGNATLYSWSNNNTSIGLAANGTYAITPFTAVNTGSPDVVATITITPISTVNGFSCIGELVSFTITVKPSILINDIPDQILCTLTLSTAVTFENLPGVTYEWVNDDPSIGLPANGTGNIPSFFTQNIGSVAVIANITVTPVAAGVQNTAVSFSIKVNPTPVMTPVSDFRYCSGTTTDAIIFGGIATEFEWTNSNKSIGLAASGTGNIPSFVATDLSGFASSGNIFVRNYTNDGVRCQGTSETFTIIVNPTPLMNNVTNRNLCSGSVNGAINFSGVSATQYQWTNDNINIGLPADGSGNIAPFVGINTTNANITGNIVVTPQFIGNGFFCLGPSKNFQITVLPLPGFDPIPSQRVCAGTAVNSINLTADIPNTIFTWTNDNATIGLPASGTGNIPSFIAVNNGSVPASANVTVSLSANGCNGLPRAFNIIVDPVPVVAPIADQVYCNNNNTNFTDFTSNISGAGGFTWTNDNPAIGLPASGGDFIQSFNATNTGATAITATITVIKTAGNCNSEPVTFTITVNPSPTGNSISDLTVCNGSATDAINLTGGQSDNTYNWTNNDPSIVLAASGIGDIPSFIPINSATNSIKSALITVHRDQVAALPVLDLPVHLLFQ